MFSDSATIGSGPMNLWMNTEKLLVGFGVKHDECVVHFRYLRTFLRLFVIVLLRSTLFFCLSSVMTGR